MIGLGLGLGLVLGLELGARVKVRALLSPHCHWDRRQAVQQSSRRVEHRVVFLPADRLEVVFLVGGLRMRGRG